MSTGIDDDVSEYDSKVLAWTAEAEAEAARREHPQEEVAAAMAARDAARVTASIIQDELEEAKEAKERYGDDVIRLRSECTRLLRLLNQSATHRERDLLRQIKRLEHQCAEQRRELGGLKTSLGQRERYFERLETAFSVLAEKDGVPFAPCSHDRNPRSCIRCVAAWLGREGLLPEVYPRRGTQ